MESGSNEEIKDFIVNNNINYKVIVGDAKTGMDFQIPGFPTTVIIDKNGTLSEKFVGSNPNLYEMITKKVENLLNS
jgi:hypothetical protein